MFLKSSYIHFIAVLLLSTLGAYGQTNPENADQGKTPPGPVFKVGPGITPPRTRHAPNPDYSEEAREAGYEGTCVLWLIVGPDGNPYDIRVARSLGLGLDEKAIEAVRKWRFEPAQKDGGPVAVQINVELAFRLTGSESERISRLEKRANAGDARAQLQLSTAYFAGLGVPQNKVLGLDLLQRAASRGLPLA